MYFLVSLFIARVINMAGDIVIVVDLRSMIHGVSSP